MSSDTQDITPKTKVRLTIKELILIVVFAGSMLASYMAFATKAEVTKADADLKQEFINRDEKLQKEYLDKVDKIYGYIIQQAGKQASPSRPVGGSRQ